MLCDSNILIYAADSDDTSCSPFVERDDAVIASVSRIEVLGFPGFENLSLDRQTRLHDVVASIVEMPLDENVIRRAIGLRQQKKDESGGRDNCRDGTGAQYSLGDPQCGRLQTCRGFEIDQSFRTRVRRLKVVIRGFIKAVRFNE